MTLTTVEAEPRTEIRPLTRQVSRQITRRAHRCRRCPMAVTDPQTAVFDNGHVSHRECAERINEMVDQVNHEAATKRAEASGLVLPPAGGGLLLPPSAREDTA